MAFRISDNPRQRHRGQGLVGLGIQHLARDRLIVDLGMPGDQAARALVGRLERC